MFELSREERKKIAVLADRFMVVFRPEVLAQYDAQPHKYKVERSDFEGEVSVADTYAESLDYDVPREYQIRVRFGYRRLKSGDYAVAAFIPDFQNYGDGHLPLWHPYMVAADEIDPGTDHRFEAWAARYLLGSWEVDNNVLERITAQLRLLNGLTAQVLGHTIFHQVENAHLKTPASESDHAYQDAHKELYGLLLDGLNVVTVDEILARSGNIAPKSAKFTRKRLEAALGGSACPTLWAILDTISYERGKAAHKIRPAAQPCRAFDQFVQDLERVEIGVGELTCALETLLGVKVRSAAARHDALERMPAIVRKPPNTAANSYLHRATGKRLVKVEWGPVEDSEHCHRREVVQLHFEDDSILWLDTGSNAGNLAMKNEGIQPSDFDVYVWAGYVPSLEENWGRDSE